MSDIYMIFRSEIVGVLIDSQRKIQCVKAEAYDKILELVAPESAPLPPYTPVSASKPTDARLAPDDTPAPMPDDGPSPDDAAGADLAPAQPPEPRASAAQPTAPTEEPAQTPKKGRGRPKKVADVPTVDVDDIPAAPPVPPPTTPPVDDLPWGGKEPTPAASAAAGPIASGFGDDDQPLPDDGLAADDAF